MILEEFVVSLCDSTLHPPGCCLVRVYADICLGVTEIRVEIDFIIGVGCYVETYLIGTFDVYLAFLYLYLATFVDSLHAHGVLHTVVVELCFPHKTVIAILLQSAFRYRVRSIAECEVLHSLLVCTELHNQYVCGI